MPPTKFRDNRPFDSGEEAKNRFSRWLPWRSFWISDRNYLAIFDLQVFPMFPTKFRVSWPFRSGEEAKKWIFKMAIMAAVLDFRSERFWLCLIYKSPRWFLPSFEPAGLLVQEKKRKIDFQNGRHGGHLVLPIGTILAIFDLQVTLMFLTKFRVH